MLSRLYNSWQLMRQKLWAVPAGICVLFFAFIIAVLVIERLWLLPISSWSILYQGSVAEAKDAVGLLLSAMITMTTLAVSITVVVLSLAASQLGPRLIRSFITDRGTQLYIGYFFGTVTACFLLTGILHDLSLAIPTPRLTISVVFGMCFVSLFVLLGFTHHVARSSIADIIVEQVGGELMRAVRRISKSNSTPEDDDTVLPSDFDSNSRPLYFKDSGYIQNIDYSHLLDLAEEHDLYIKVEVKAGHFLMPGENGVIVSPARHVDADVEKDLNRAFIIGEERTPTQDIEYAMRHLVEIAIRALSPGINDSFTALTVIDKLSAALAVLFDTTLPRHNRWDENGDLRVKATADDEATFISHAFDQIRHSGQDKPVVLTRLLNRISVLARIAQNKTQRQALQREVALIGEAIERHFAGTKEGEPLRAKLQEVETVLKYVKVSGA